MSPSWPKSAPNEDGVSADSRSLSTLRLCLAAAGDSSSDPQNRGPQRGGHMLAVLLHPLLSHAWGNLKKNTGFLSFTQCSIAPRHPASDALRWPQMDQGHSSKELSLTRSQLYRVPAPALLSSRAASDPPSATATQACRPGT